MTPDWKDCKFSGCQFMLVISPPSIFLKEHSVWRSSPVTRMISSGWLLWTGMELEAEDQYQRGARCWLFGSAKQQES